MCGRMACNLCREGYQKACTYRDVSSNKYVKPPWIDLKNGGATFHPSNNICPTDITPVLCPGSVFPDDLPGICLAPMMWGLIPRWHKGEAKKHGLSTSNCRIEGIRNADSKGGSKLYTAPLREGKRCIVVCEGYYEWQTTKETKNKQPYYIYATQNENVKVEDVTSWENAHWDETTGWTGPKLLKLAALYDIWNDNFGEQIYSYSIITMDTNEKLSWLHHRMPAIVADENLVQDWLDPERVSPSRAVSFLSPVTAISWHPVSTRVNNAKNKDSNVNQPLKSEKTTFSPLQNWLKTGTTTKRSIDNDEATERKKFKD